MAESGVSAFCYTRRVEFAETDMAGIVHFSNFFRYMEMAEHAFLRSLGLSVHTRIDDQLISWPRIHAQCSYRSPLAFEDEFEVRLTVREKTSRTVTYGFQFRRPGERKLIAIGEVKVACVSIDPATRKMVSTDIPSAINEKIAVHLKNEMDTTE